MFASNPTIELLCRHRSIRAYTNEPVSDDQINTIIKAAQAVSSSLFLQTATIIRITDRAAREKLANLSSGQRHIIEAPEFWVFCADFNRNKQIDGNLAVNNVENLLVGTIDTAIMAQNAVIAAESLGLGCVYIGAIRNRIEEVTKMLDIPKYVVPLFGLCLGYPAQDPQIKPRLPKELVFFENHYQPIDHELVAAYDKIMRDYYQGRRRNKKSYGWIYSLGNTVNAERYGAMLAYLQKQGWIEM